MRMILLAGAVLALSACGGGNNGNTATDNLAVDANMSLDGTMPAGQNGSVNAALAGVNAAAANGSVNAATANAMAKDAKTHDPDTNLANGM